MRNCGCHSHNGLILSPEGLAQRTGDQLSLDGMGIRQYVDRVGSVSGLELERDLYEIQTAEQFLEQSERYLNGC